jgi:hypothetical protein
VTASSWDRRLLGLALARGAKVEHAAADENGEPLFRREVGRADC